VVSVLSPSLCSVCSLWQNGYISNSGHVGSPTRLGPWADSLFAVYGRSAETDREPQSVSCTHVYANDTQIYGFCSPADAAQLQLRMSTCVDEVASWMLSNRSYYTQHRKDGVPWCTTSRPQHQLPQTPTRIGNESVSPATFVACLSCHIRS